MSNSLRTVPPTTEARKVSETCLGEESRRLDLTSSLEIVVRGVVASGANQL